MANQHRRHLNLCSCLTCLCLALRAGGQAAAPEQAHARADVVAAHEGVRWESNLKRARAQARRLERPLLVSFWAVWCPWCKRFDQLTYRDSRVTALTRDVVALKVDVEGGLDETRFAAELGVESVPTVVFLSPYGRRLATLTRFQGPDEFAATLLEMQAAAASVRAWEQTLARDGGDAAALAGLGAWLLERPGAHDAQPLLRRATSVDGARPAQERKRTRVGLATLLAREGKSGEAQRLLSAALALSPADAAQDASALTALGALHASGGRTQRARESFEAALRLAPEGDTARLAREALARLPAR